MTLDGEPEVNAVQADLQTDGNRVAVTVPNVQYFKTVLFGF